LLGITPEVWARLQEPRKGGSDDLAQTTELFFATHIALEYFHCSYTEYVQRVPRMERLLFQFYVQLKNLKEEHAHEQMQAEAEMERQAQAILPHGMTGRL